jgi:4-hydroxy-4-methyl-2-oxoglutarate aldolase
MDAGERRRLLERCKGIRVTDWHDAVDSLGLLDCGLMAQEIRPLWRDIEGMSHCVVGIAYTVRYVPASERFSADTPEAYQKKVGQWYGAQLRWAEGLEPGDLIVFDGSGNPGCGYIGSMNSLTWLARGVVGMVSNTGVRDSDELIKQRVPVYHNGFCRGIQPNRVHVDSFQKPIECGGVYVRPGDLVVADGDGVMVIPAELVEKALPIARDIQQGDQKSRAELYDKLGIPPDATLGDARPK